MYSPTVLTCSEAAQALGITETALIDGRRRRLDRGDKDASPPFCRVGRSIRYLRASVEPWSVAIEHPCLCPIEPDSRLPHGLDASELPEVVSDYQAQGILRMSDCALRARRRKGDCPPWTVEGRTVTWRVADLLEWMKAHERDETLTEAMARAPSSRPVASVSAAPA